MLVCLCLKNAKKKVRFCCELGAQWKSVFPLIMSFLRMFCFFRKAAENWDFWASGATLEDVFSLVCWFNNIFWEWLFINPNDFVSCHILRVGSSRYKAIEIWSVSPCVVTCKSCSGAGWWALKMRFFPLSSFHQGEWRLPRMHVLEAGPPALRCR